MKNVLLVSILCSASFFLRAQNTFPASGPVGIGTSSPSVSLEVFKTGVNDPIARFGSTTATNSHAIWVYNGVTSFSKVFIAGGSSAFFNGTQQGDGGLLVTTGKALFMGDGGGNPTMIMKGGNVGIGYISTASASPGMKLQVNDGAEDATPYGSVQIIRSATPGDNKFHLTFVRAGQMYSGIGYVNGTNTLGIWGGGNTSTTPTIAFTQSGNVGIGAANPNYKLTVDPQVSTGGGILIGNPSTGSGGYTSLIAGISAQSGGYAFLQGTTSSGSSYGVMSLNPNGGNVLVGKTSQTNSGYILDINGATRANKVVVNTTGADFVFDSSYDLKPLAEVETYISRNKHLPGIAPAADMQKEGLDLGSNQTKLLQKIEELTLYMIEQKKEIEGQNKKIEVLEAQTKILQEKLTGLSVKKN